MGGQDLRDGSADAARRHPKWKERYFLDLVAPSLGRRIKLAKAVDTITKEFDPERPELARGEDVDYAAASGERTCLNNWIFASVSDAIEVIEEHFNEKLIAYTHGQAQRFNLFGRRNGMQQGWG